MQPPAGKRAFVRIYAMNWPGFEPDLNDLED